MDLYSASGVNTWDRCERRFGFKYIDKLPDPAGSAAALGTECENTQLQPYLLEGRPLDYTRPSGYIVQPVLAYLPKPKSAFILQRHFVMPSPSFNEDGSHVGFGFQGYLDMWVPDPSIMPDAAYDPKQGPRILPDGTTPPVVPDFKTTGNWDYAKTPEKLKTDTQAQLYATWAMYFTGARVVDLQWFYMGTKGKRVARRFHLRVTADHVAEQFTKINASALAMHAAKKGKVRPLALAPNPAACGDFGGCPYQALCNLSPGEKIEAAAAQHARRQGVTMTEEASTGGLIARMRAKKAAEAAAAGGVAVVPAGAGATATVITPPAGPHPDVAPLEQKTQEKIDDVVARAATAQAAAIAAEPPVPPLPAWATAPVDPIRQAATHAARAAAAAAPLGINPPEAALPPAPPVGSVVAPAAPVPGSTPSVTHLPAEAAPAKRGGPGRPRKSKTDPLGADVAAHTSKQMTIDELVMPPEQTFETEGRLLETVSVTWGKETVWPDRSAGCEVGPFEATGSVREGETIAQAKARIYADLVAFAEQARAVKAASFKAFLQQIGIAK